MIDTQNLFAAQGITAVEAVRLRDAGEGAPKIRARLEYLALHTHGYMIPRDLYYLRARARTKGDRSVGLLSAALGTALDIKPVLHGYRGETEPVAKIKGFDNAVQQAVRAFAARPRRRRADDADRVPELRRRTRRDARPARLRRRCAMTCAAHNVEVFESVMSLTGMVNVGKGALVVGFAAEPHDFG